MDEFLLDGPVGGFDHRVVVWVAGSGKGTCDAEHVEHAFDAFPGEPAAAVRVEHLVLLQCLFDRFGSVFPQCGLMVFPGVVIVSR